MPLPQTQNGMGLFTALKKRASASGATFKTTAISPQELSTVLWAASGLNRGKNGWTVPMANGLPPYIDIYVVGEQGVYQYHWLDNTLTLLLAEDIRSEVALQSFVKRAAYLLLFVTNGDALATFNDTDKANNFAHLAVGAMSQNVYLSASALKLQIRYIHQIKANVISQLLNLPKQNHVIGLMLLGK